MSSALMNRLAEGQLVSWQESNEKKPLVLQGAVRVGKTTLIREFARKYFSCGYIEIDCSDEETVEFVLGRHANLGGMLSAIEQRLGSWVDQKNTLLIFDNFGGSPSVFRKVLGMLELHSNLRTAIVGTPDEKCAASISRLNEELHIVNLYPLCFAEFLSARKKSVCAEIVLSEPRALDAISHNELIRELRTYITVGGLPECIVKFLEASDHSAVVELQEQLVSILRSTNYGEEAPERCVEEIFRRFPAIAGDQTQFIELAEDMPLPTIKHTFDLLEVALVAHRVLAASPYDLTGPATNPKNFKTLLMDVGLLYFLMGLAGHTTQGTLDLVRLNGGALADQFLGQEMIVAQGKTPRYWCTNVRDGTSRVNFVTKVAGSAIPIIIPGEDVKTSDTWLSICLDSYPACPYGLRFSDEPYSPQNSKERLRTMPLYYAFSATGGLSRYPKRLLQISR